MTVNTEYTGCVEVMESCGKKGKKEQSKGDGAWSRHGAVLLPAMARWSCRVPRKPGAFLTAVPSPHST